MALQNHFEGQVSILTYIDKNGEGRRDKAVDGKGSYGFASAATEAILATKFEPGIIGRERVAVKMTIPVSFIIR